MDTNNLCEICNNVVSKYTCPKCSKLYCSLNCYRGPSHQGCSEIFYRDCVTEELAARSLSRNDPRSVEDAKRMYETLKKMNEAPCGDDDVASGLQDEDDDLEEENIDSDDDLNEEDLATRLEGINLDNPDAIWSHLTAAEKQEFESLLQTGDIENVIPIFTPWWEIQIAKQLIRDMDEKPEDIPKLKHPKLIECITPFASIMKKSPSPCLPNNLYNILSCYTCCVRFFNGEHHLTPVEAALYIIENSATLKRNANFDDAEQAVKSVIAECNNGDGLPDWKYIAKDVEKIMGGPYEGKRDPVYVKAALADIHRILVAAKHNLKSKLHVDLDGGLNKKMLLSVLKKIEFFLSFVNESC